jgi:hypothetical protein
MTTDRQISDFVRRLLTVGAIDDVGTDSDADSASVVILVPEVDSDNNSNLTAIYASFCSAAKTCIVGMPIAAFAQERSTAKFVRGHGIAHFPCRRRFNLQRRLLLALVLQQTTRDTRAPSTFVAQEWIVLKNSDVIPSSSTFMTLNSKKKTRRAMIVAVASLES